MTGETIPSRPIEETDPTAEILDRSLLPAGFGELDITSQMVIVLGYCTPRGLTPSLLWQCLDPQTRDEYSKGAPPYPHGGPEDFAAERLERMGIVERDVYNDETIMLSEKGWGCFAEWTAPQ